MRKSLTLFTISLALVVFTAFKAVDEWIIYTSKEGNFSITMPTEPKIQRDTVTVNNGSKATTHIFIARDNKDIFIIGYADYAASAILDPQTELEVNRDDFLKAVDGTLIENRNIKFGDHPGIYFTGKGKTSGYLWTCYIYVIGKRPYQLVVGSPDGVSSVNEKKFFSSFKLLD